MWHDIREVIQQNEYFLITTHVNPDGDGIGAACGMTELLLQMGKKVKFVCDSPIPKKFAFLDYHRIHEEYHPDKKYDDIQVLMVLDTHKRERIGRLAELIDRPGITTLCLDHHEVERPFTKHIVIDPKACSVGAMVYSLYKQSGRSLNFRAAVGIYSSIVSDTGRFSYSSTSRRAHKIADECIKAGVDPDWVCTRLFQHVSLEQIKLFARALQTMELHIENKVAIQQISAIDCNLVGMSPRDLEHIDLEYMHDFNNNIENVKCFVLLREIAPNRVRVSLRSKSDVDVSRIVRVLGGGGHANAAGASWSGPIKEVKAKIIELLRELLSCKLYTQERLICPTSC